MINSVYLCVPRTNEIPRVVGPRFFLQINALARGGAVARGAGAHHAADPVGCLPGPRLARYRGGMPHAVHHQARAQGPVGVGGK
jgi:hypothetical protein